MVPVTMMDREVSGRLASLASLFLHDAAIRSRIRPPALPVVVTLTSNLRYAGLHILGRLLLALPEPCRNVARTPRPDLLGFAQGSEHTAGPPKRTINRHGWATVLRSNLSGRHARVVHRQQFFVRRKLTFWHG